MICVNVYIRRPLLDPLIVVVDIYENESGF
jgi:hypothetical protein